MVETRSAPAAVPNPLCKPICQASVFLRKGDRNGLSAWEKGGWGGAGDSMVKGSHKETQDEDGELLFSFQLDYYCLGGSFPF